MTEWQAWKDRIWDSLAAHLGYPGLAPLEQYMIRSKKERCCVECGKTGTVECHSQIVKSVDIYWMCQGCTDYWASKG